MSDIPVMPSPQPHRTLIDSTPGVHKAWQTFAEDYNFDAAAVAHASHGRRLYDTLKEFCKIDDEDKLLVCPGACSQARCSQILATHAVSQKFSGSRRKFLKGVRYNCRVRIVLSNRSVRLSPRRSDLLSFSEHIRACIVRQYSSRLDTT